MQMIEQTADGSHTIFDAESGLRYHSTHGAIQESMHVFIEAGLAEMSKIKKSISVLEMGFGTGLNVLLTCLYAQKHQLGIFYETIEKEPLPPEIVRKLNYSDLLQSENEHGLFSAIHSGAWDKTENINGNLRLLKRKADMLEAILSHRYDLVYYDAFDPAAQPELWSLEMFRKIADRCNEQAILVTYSSKGSVRRNLVAAGFRVQKLPGPKGKREMIRAIKS